MIEQAVGPATGDAERRDRLRLIRSDRIGPINFRDLLARFGTAGAALAAVSDLARQQVAEIDRPDAVAADQAQPVAPLRLANGGLDHVAALPACLRPMRGSVPVSSRRMFAWCLAQTNSARIAANSTSCRSPMMIQP